MVGWKWMAILWFGSFVPSATAQVRRIGQSVPKPQLTLGDTLTVTASPGAITFQLVSRGVALGSGPISVTTTVTGLSLLGSLALYGFFTSASAALSGGTPVANIPSSNILGKVPTGTPTTYTPFTQTSPFGGAGAGLLLFTGGVVLSLGSSRTDALSLEIDLTTLPQQPAAIYTGILVLQAQAF
jgi:hypothetical protein